MRKPSLATHCTQPRVALLLACMWLLSAAPSYGQAPSWWVEATASRNSYYSEGQNPQANTLTQWSQSVTQWIGASAHYALQPQWWVGLQVGVNHRTQSNYQSFATADLFGIDSARYHYPGWSTSISVQYNLVNQDRWLIGLRLRSGLRQNFVKGGYYTFRNRNGIIERSQSTIAYDTWSGNSALVPVFAYRLLGNFWINVQWDALRVERTFNDTRYPNNLSQYNGHHSISITPGATQWGLWYSF